MALSASWDWWADTCPSGFHRGESAFEGSVEIVFDKSREGHSVFATPSLEPHER